ncbi:hypothetical protein [Bradyrhizobium sp. Ai1a-2]|uniref:hypothetical protein n=1 Tax=Bradyrhizobium sp. Ai1a-2 TaxID=196490 RepID=UPI0004846D62|nr:hypothetical protein [Bradyrhizobium sp. Ai1a-2]
METLETSQQQAVVRVSIEELLIVNAVLNETCNGIEIFEFETRVGASRQRVVSLLREVQALLKSMERTE